MRRHPVRFLLVAAICACDHGGSGSASPTPTVAITSPEVEVHGSGPVVIQVVVKGCAPATVELLVDADTLANLVPPFQYTWDTGFANEGRREVVARASCGGAPATSAPVAIWVDRTPPAIADRAPAPGSATACVTEPIAVAFTEPIDLDGAAAIVLRHGGAVVPATITASDGGARLTIAPADVLIPGDGYSVEIGASVRDLAGHALGTSDAWSFSYPWFCQPTHAPLAPQGATVSEPHLALADVGPYVVWRPGSFLATYAYDGSRFVEDLVPTTWGLDSSVAVLGADVLVADTVSELPGFQIRLQRDRDGALSAEGPALGQEGGYETSPALTFAQDGTPVIAWQSWSSTSGGLYQVRAAFLDGGAWADRGSPSLNVDPSAWALSPCAGRDAQGRPAVAFIESGRAYLRRWDGSGWTIVGGGPLGPDSAYAPSLAFDGDDPYVAYADTGGGLHVYHLAGGAWTQLPADPRRSTAPANTPAIALYSEGHPVVAWTEGSIGAYPNAVGALYVSVWNGSQWVPLGDAINGGASYPAYAPALVSAYGNPTVAWAEPTAPVSDVAPWNVRLARINR